MSHSAFAIPILISSFVIYCQTRVAVTFRKPDRHTHRRKFCTLSRNIYLSLLVQPAIYRYTLRNTPAHFTCKVLILTKKGDEVGLYVVRSQAKWFRGRHISFLGFSTS